MRDSLSALPLYWKVLPVLLSIVSCSPADTHQWERIDLWATKPRVVSNVAKRSRGRIFRARLDHLGRAWKQMAGNRSRRLPPGSAQVRALEQRFGSRLGWTIDLGDEAYFSFIPLGSSDPATSGTYRVSVRHEEGDIQELYSLTPEQVCPFAPATVEVDLGAYARSRIELLLETDQRAGAVSVKNVFGMRWGSPAVYTRRPELPPMPKSNERPSVLLIGADTLRADALGAYGRAPSLTPALDRLAAESDVWLEAFSTFNNTNPSFVSIMTGLYGKNHGVYNLKTPLAQESTTLAEIFSGAGYDTLAVVSARHLGDDRSGLGQGFDKVVISDDQFAAELAVDSAMDWMASREKPFFLWLHLFDPHTPHTPPQPYALGFRAAACSGLWPVAAWVQFRNPGPLEYTEPTLGGHRELYAGEVAYLDRQIDRLIGFLDSRQLGSSTIVVFMADHGENLGEHGIFFRHSGLFTTTTHVPLMIRWQGPKRPGRRLAKLVQTIDLFPTILATAGLKIPPQDGIDLRKLTCTNCRGRRAVFAEHANGFGAMVRTSRYLYAVSHGHPVLPDGVTLYDVKENPDETQNLAGRGLPAERKLARFLRRWQAKRRSTPGPPESGATT